jgi:hypothetical protein
MGAITRAKEVFALVVGAVAAVLLVGVLIEASRFPEATVIVAAGLCVLLFTLGVMIGSRSSRW